jgi:hypothetical protein
MLLLRHPYDVQRDFLVVIFLGCDVTSSFDFPVHLIEGKVVFLSILMLTGMDTHNRGKAVTLSLIGQHLAILFSWDKPGCCTRQLRNFSGHKIRQFPKNS